MDGAVSSSARSPVVDVERMRSVGNYCQLRLVVWLSFGALTLLVG